MQLTNHSTSLYSWVNLNPFIPPRTTSHDKMMLHAKANIVYGLSKYDLKDWHFNSKGEPRHKKSDPYYLNLKLSQMRGRGPDFAIFASNKKSISCIYVPILIGEILSSGSDETSAIHQLIYLMIIFARPFRVNNNKCDLLGFILHPEAKYVLIVEVHTNGWMSSSSLFSCTVRKYRNTLSLENEIFLANFLHELLDTFVSGLKSFNEVDLKLTCQPLSKTIRFGIESKSLSMLRQVDNYPTCNIIKCRLSDFKSLIPSHAFRADNLDSISDDTPIFVKASGSFLSISVTNSVSLSHPVKFVLCNHLL